MSNSTKPDIVIDQYRQNVSLITDVAMEHPEKLADMMIQGNTKGMTELMKTVKENRTAAREYCEIAKEIADITISAESLYEVVALKKISNALLKRIHKNYRSIVGINSGLIVLGVAGVLAPATSALCHNVSTLLISLNSMKNLLPEE